MTYPPEWHPLAKLPPAWWSAPWPIAPTPAEAALERHKAGGRIRSLVRHHEPPIVTLADLAHIARNPPQQSNFGTVTKAQLRWIAHAECGEPTS
jgi:hypothetical protein